MRAIELKTFCAPWSPDGRMIACSGYDHIRIFDAAAGKLLAAWQDLCPGDGTKNLKSIAWSPDSTRLATARHWSGNAIGIWNVEGRLHQELEHHGPNGR